MNTTELESFLINNKDTTELDLHNKEITDEIALIIAKHLKDYKQLETLCLNNNNIGNKGIKTILESIVSSSFKNLYLDENCIGNEGIKYIGNFMIKYKKIVELSLFYQQIEEDLFNIDGAIVLAAAIKVNPKLEVLNLAGYGIGNDESDTIIKAINYTQSVKSLNLEENKIDNDGAKIFAEHLKNNKSIKELFIGGNIVMGDAGIKYIMDALTINNTIKLIDLLGCQGIGAEGIKYITDTLKTNQDLTKCIFDNGKIDDEFLNHTLNMIKINSIITSIDFDINDETIDPNLLENIESELAKNIKMVEQTAQFLLRKFVKTDAKLIIENNHDELQVADTKYFKHYQICDRDLLDETLHAEILKSINNAEGIDYILSAIHTQVERYIAENFLQLYGVTKTIPENQIPFSLQELSGEIFSFLDKKSLWEKKAVTNKRTRDEDDNLTEQNSAKKIKLEGPSMEQILEEISIELAGYLSDIE